jgi:FdhD protein
MNDESGIARVEIRRYESLTASAADDSVAVEEPLEIRIGEKPVSVTMRTPGDDFALAAGFLAGESLITSADAIESIRHWSSPNVVRVDLRGDVNLRRLERHFYTTSSCGVCGKTSIEALRVESKPVVSSLRVAPATLALLPSVLRARQTTFASTGGLHAAGLFASDGSLLSLAEDVGRHNAVDKVIGRAILDRSWPLDDRILMVSGRTSFEIVQKAIMARIPFIAAISAPTSLAVDLARQFTVTLAGFVRDGRFNVYAGEERVR